MKQFIVLVLAAFTPLLGFAETTDENKEGDAQVVIDDFNQDSISRWKFVSDQVMGGVSTGDVEFVLDGDDVVPQPRDLQDDPGIARMEPPH